MEDRDPRLPPPHKRQELGIEYLTEDEKNLLLDIRRNSFLRGGLFGGVTFAVLKALQPRYEVLRTKRYVIPVTCVFGAIVGVGSYGPTATRRMLSLPNSRKNGILRTRTSRTGVSRN